MLTKIDICSMALLKIGEKPIQSFNEDTAAAQLARTLFEAVSDALIAGHPWRFASRTFDLTKTESGDFLVPAEILRVISCSAQKYEIKQNRIKSSADKISITAIVRTDVENYPAFFTSCLATRLAMEFCMPLSDNQNAFNTLAALFDSELRAAKFIDSTMSSGTGVQNFSLISARY
ncbi:MAG: hypothetical protein FWG39_00290 [Alphaproteobacteria bacterium]|nr:hypothetical protein [Alphaproteobacteria bacterium]